MVVGVRNGVEVASKKQSLRMRTLAIDASSSTRRVGGWETNGHFGSRLRCCFPSGMARIPAQQGKVVVAERGGLRAMQPPMNRDSIGSTGNDNSSPERNHCTIRGIEVGGRVSQAAEDAHL